MGFSVRASARFVPMSPRKVRLVLDGIRGLPVQEALAVLRLTPKAAARPVSKLVASAIANAKENYGLEAEELFISEISAGPGPTQRRYRFGARGRYKPILKRSCHIAVGLSEMPTSSQEPEPRGGRSAAKA
jgi:large subunit ribosomal protein L22